MYCVCGNQVNRHWTLQAVSGGHGGSLRDSSTLILPLVPIVMADPASTFPTVHVVGAKVTVVPRTQKIFLSRLEARLLDAQVVSVERH
jgi:hypothetical protein